MLTDEVHHLRQEDTAAAETTCGLVDEITQSKPATRRDHLRLGDRSAVATSSAVNRDVLANLTKQHDDARSRIDTTEFGLAADLAVHGTRHVNHNLRATQQLRGTREATEHRLLKLLLKPRGILRRRDETEREHTLSTHGRQTTLDDIVRHTRLSHVAEVLQDRDCAHRALFEHTGKRRLLIRTTRQCDFPSVGSLQTDEVLRQRTILVRDLEPRLRCVRNVILVDQLRQQKALILVLRLCVRQENHVTQLDVLVLVPLCKLVLGELVVRTGQTLLDLSGERLLPVLPVDREELRDLVRTLNDGEQRIRHECLVVGGRTCHLTHYEQRCVTELLLITGLDREFSTLLRGSLVDELLDQTSDGRAVDVEIVFPQHAGVQETLKLKSLVDSCCGGSGRGVHLRTNTSSCCVDGCHVISPIPSSIRLPSPIRQCCREKRLELGCAICTALH